MSKSLLATAATAALVLSSCDPLPVVPPPRFRPNPPYAPEQVDRYDRSPDRYDQEPDRYDQAPDRYREDTYQQPQPAQPTRPGEYPTARRSGNPNEVTSPYEPYNTIDVEGFSSGQLARDPSNNKIFRVP